MSEYNWHDDIVCYGPQCSYCPRERTCSLRRTAMYIEQLESKPPYNERGIGDGDIVALLEDRDTMNLAIETLKAEARERNAECQMLSEALQDAIYLAEQEVLRTEQLEFHMDTVEKMAGQLADLCNKHINEANVVVSEMRDALEKIEVVTRSLDPYQLNVQIAHILSLVRNGLAAPIQGESVGDVGD